MFNESDDRGERHHEVFADPTLGDAILDRLVHTILAQGNAYRLELKGESMRKTRSLLPSLTT